MTRCRWPSRLFVVLALLGWCGVCGAEDAGTLRLETKWLRAEFDAASGAIIGLASDPAGGGDFSQPIVAGDAERGYGVFAACRAPDGQIEVGSPGDSFGIVPTLRNSVTITGLRVGEALTARLEASLAPDAPELTLRVVIRAEAETTYRWAGLLLALDPKLAPSTVYFAGRQGLASASSGQLVVPEGRVSGAVCKQGAQRTFLLASARTSGAEIEVEKEGIHIALAPAIGGEPVTLQPGQTVSVEARLVFGSPRVPQLKPVTSKFRPLAQDFIFWASHIATTRTSGERWLQETAAVIDPALPADIQQAYRRCWLRDIAQGWKSGVLVAGPDMLEVMSGEILTFAEKLDDNGDAPTSIGPAGDAVYGNLDSAGLLIGMIYDYMCRTGDTAFVRALLPAADRMGGAIVDLLGPHDLPVIGEGDDTYPDVGIKGEQTYLAVVCYDGLRKLARLHECLGEEQGAGRWHAAANRIADAANRGVDKQGLWDPERGVYIGWRKPDGSLYHHEESFANLWAMYSGLCSQGARIRAIYAHLNNNWERYYLDGFCPAAHSIEAYPNGLDQWVPWVGGLDLYLRTKFSEPRAQDLWRLFWADYERTDFPYREASTYKQEEPNTGNRGRIWDSWGLLQAVYAGHYGVEMTPGHLRILPRPLEYIRDDGFTGVRWRDATYDLSLRGRGLHLARVTLDAREWASCVFPPSEGKHRIEMTQSSGARAAFVIDAAPTVAMLAAEHRERGLYLEVSAPSPGRYWMVIQWPDAWGRMNAESVAGGEFPQVVRLAGERAAIMFTLGRAGECGITLAGSTLLTP